MSTSCQKDFTLHVGDPCAGVDWKNNVTNCRLRIKNFNPADWPFCANCPPSADPVWDGKFPLIVAPGGNYGFPAGFSLGGISLLGGWNNVVFFAGAWGIQLVCGTHYYWVALPGSPTTPIGVYANSNNPNCGGGPLFIELEAYTL